MSPDIQDKYPGIQFSQFTGAEMMAKKYGLTKDQLDEYAYNGVIRSAIAATQGGAFKGEIVPIQITTEGGEKEQHHIDEGIRFNASLDGIKGVKAAGRGRRADRRHIKPDLRWRVGLYRRQREGPEAAWASSRSRASITCR